MEEGEVERSPPPPVPIRTRRVERKIGGNTIRPALISLVNTRIGVARFYNCIALIDIPQILFSLSSPRGECDSKTNFQNFLNPSDSRTELIFERV